MKIVFLSNYFSHHQRPLSDELSAQSSYTFVSTQPMTEERLSLGWGTEPEPEYVLHYDRNPSWAEELLKQADVIITGSAPEALVRKCIQRGQLVLRYAERPLKKGNQWHKYVPRFIKWHMQNPVGKPIYLLCASAYTAGDYARFGLFRGRAFCWGYFPETRYYASVEDLLAEKKPRSILWAGRLLDWKHPDDAVRVAARLKAAGIDFEMKLIGRGPMEAELCRMIEEQGLQGCVCLLGAMKPEAVRKRMEQSEIFLFTSDRREGWGAVLNEAMNSGCAVVASEAAGAAPYLVRNQENGLLYQSGDVDGLFEAAKKLLDNPSEAVRMGCKAYETILTEWNASVAAERLIQLAQALLDGSFDGCSFHSGPCSDAGE